MSKATYLIAVFGNIWLYKIASLSLLAFVVLAITSTLFIIYLSKDKSAKVGLISFLIIIALQLANFAPINLTELTNDDIRVRDERLSLYPNNLLQIGYYLEQRPEMVAVRRLTNALFNSLDPNIYFFAGHPRQKVGVLEFEKLPYIFLPLFLIGIYVSLEKRKMFLVLFLFAFVLAALNSKTSALGSMVLFPFFAAIIYFGALHSIKLVNKSRHKNYLYILFFIIYFLVIIQTVSYEVY